MAQRPSILRRMLRPFVVNEASTRDSEWYPELGPREFPDDPDAVFGAAEEAIRERPRWRIVDRGGGRRRIDVEVTTRVFKFVDDFRIDIDEKDGGSAVHARSRSRAGVGDFGKNARTIREFFDRLEAEFE